VTVRVRFADLHSVTRSVTLDTPISATASLAEIAHDLMRTVLADHPAERSISLLAISVSHLEEHWHVQLGLPLGLEGEERRPGTTRGRARWIADRAVDMIRDRFGWEAVGYGSVASGLSRSRSGRISRTRRESRLPTTRRRPPNYPKRPTLGRMTLPAGECWTPVSLPPPEDFLNY
jgi:hypothetical protein